MRLTIRHYAAATFLTLFLFVAFVTSHPHPSNTTVHEWGTFTSIAGPDGVAMEWMPLSGPSDLPPFVEHLANAGFKGGLRGTVRMETPVLYFYSPQETRVSVHVSFSQGLITEWYPHGAVPALNPRRDVALQQKHTEGTISWDSVLIQPTGAEDFPAETGRGHYSAARQTASAPLSIETPAGVQHEKFLFYRGVSAVLPSLTAAQTSDKSVALQNHFPATIANAVLFERRGSRVGYRIVGPLADQASFAPPALNGSLESLYSDLEGVLVGQGLYAAEAHAMLETWKDSWFEEGSRILYIVPRAFVDSVLPLTISPPPAQITRVFVGRLELITPATKHAVESAFAANDSGSLAKYNRFVEPILQSMLQAAPDEATRARFNTYLNSAYGRYYAQAH